MQTDALSVSHENFWFLIFRGKFIHKGTRQCAVFLSSLLNQNLVLNSDLFEAKNPTWTLTENERRL